MPRMSNAHCCVYHITEILFVESQSRHSLTDVQLALGLAYAAVDTLRNVQCIV